MSKCITVFAVFFLLALPSVASSSPRCQTKHHRCTKPLAHETVAEVIIKEMSVPCQNTTLMPAADNITLVEEATLCLINHERAKYGELPLHLNARLDAAALNHDWEMVSDNYFAHVSPSGISPLMRAKKEGFLFPKEGGYIFGENIAWGTYEDSTPVSIVQAWMESPGHRANILESKYTETGVNVLAELPSSVAEGQTGALYAQEFAVIIR